MLKTKRTARSRTSGNILVFCLLANPLKKLSLRQVQRYHLSNDDQIRLLIAWNVSAYCLLRKKPPNQLLARI